MSIATVRPWIIVALAAATVVVGLVTQSFEFVTLGFSTLGAELLFRAKEEAKE